MEILVGPSLTIDVSSSPPSAAYGRDHPAREADHHSVPSCLFVNEVGVCLDKDGSGYRIGGPPKFFAGESSESSSSIGTPDDSDNDLSSKRDADVGDVDEDEVQSKLNEGAALSSLNSLEDSLPIKRGLSCHFDGKSKSFTDLSQVSSVKELKKQENPFNKRRRVLIASKWSRKSAFYSWSNPKSMPLLPVDEDEDDYEEVKARKVPSPPSPSLPPSSLTEDKKEGDQVHQLRQSRAPESYATEMRLRLGSFKARSFSLADLQEHHDEEEDED